MTRLRTNNIQSAEFSDLNHYFKVTVIDGVSVRKHPVLRVVARRTPFFTIYM
jgi:hypothetical protein